MALDLEGLVVALYERLRSKVSPVQRWSRRDLMPDQIREHPTVILLQQREVPVEAGMTPTVWDVELDLTAIVLSTREEEAPDTQINAMVRAIEDALLLQDGESPVMSGEDEIHTTLGGLAVWCRISGPRERGRGEVTGEAVITIPITIRAFAQ